LKTGLGVVQGY